MNNNRKLTGVVIDAGHGGADSGAVANGIKEKDLTLEISKYIYDRLRELGIPAYLTRSGDVELTSTTRPRKVLDAFGNGSDVLVISNHINAGGGEGAEVIYALRNNDDFAKIILNNLSKEGQLIRKAYQRRLPSNPSKDYYYMLRETPNTESVIIEYGFLDNIKDANKLKNNYKNYAESIVKSITEYKNIPYTPPISSDLYVVKAGDTLWSIAKKNNIAVQELKDINNLTNNMLSVGQQLKLKTGSSIPTPPVIIDETNYYVVNSGDNLYSVAKKFGLTVDELKDINNLSSNILSIGQTLKIKSNTPPKEEAYDVYTVKKGDNLYKIASANNTTVDELIKTNNLSSNILTIGQKLIIPNTNIYKTYTVRRGDTLYAISKLYGVPVDKIKNINGLNSNTLSIGQTLLIPSNV